jgi:hypothetical protein
VGWDRVGGRTPANSTLFPGNQTGITEADGSEWPGVRADRIGLDFVKYTFELLFFMQTSSCPVSKFWLMDQVDYNGLRTGRSAFSARVSNIRSTWSYIKSFRGFVNSLMNPT